MNRKLSALIAGACALVGTLLLVSYVHTAEARATDGDVMVDVLVVSHQVKAGTPAKDLHDDVTTKQIPQKVVADGAVKSLDDLQGLIATVNLLPGEQLTKARFAKVVERSGVPDGKLEVTISLDPERALGGQVAPGDNVAVVVSTDKDDKNPALTHLILHDVQVTSVQTVVSDSSTKSSDDKTKVAPSGKLLVTLAVDAPAVEKVVFGAEHGKVWLASEPKDASHAGTQIVSLPVEYAG